MAEYLPRLLDPLLTELLAEHPAVMIVGPRACGKTATGRRHCTGRLRLDRPAEAAFARADPDAAIADGPFPLLLDEWQYVPGVLGAVKRAVDEGTGSGRFVLTGSAQAHLTAAGWPATGRLIRAAMYGLTERELEGRSTRPPFLDLLAEGGIAEITVPAGPPDVRGYIARALRGAFPEVALGDSGRARSRWLASYLGQAVSQDVANGRHAVDIVAELADGRVFGFEVKADAAPGPSAARHLYWLRDALGSRFAAGIVLHTGPRPWRIDDGIYAVPICALWG